MWYPCLGLDLSGEEIVYVDLCEPGNQKVREPMFILLGRSNLKILNLRPLCQMLSKAFSTSRIAATTCSPLSELSMMDWDSLKRSSSVDLAFLKPD